MRYSIRALAIASVAAVPAGVVALPAVAAKKPAKAACKAVPKRGGISYIVRGTLVSDATSNEILVTPTGGNAAGRRIIGAAGAYDAGVPIRIASCSKATRVLASGRQRNQTWRGMKAGDKVLVSWKAKRGATLASLGAAQRVVELRRTAK